MLHVSSFRLRPWRVVPLLLAVLAGVLLVSRPAQAQNDIWTLDYGQWTISPKQKQVGHPTITNAGREMVAVQLRNYVIFKNKEFIVDVKRDGNNLDVLTERHHKPEDVQPNWSWRDPEEIRVEAQYRFENGKLHARYAATVAGKVKPYTLRLAMPAWHYAGTDATFDGRTVRFPDAGRQARFPEARTVELYRGVPSRQWGVTVEKGSPFVVEDKRGDGDQGTFILATSAPDGKIEITIDLSQSKLREVADQFPGQSFVQQDDLHLPDLSKSRNLVSNPGFAGGFAQWSWGITGIKDTPDGKAGWYVDDKVAYEGKRSARYQIRYDYNPEMLCTFPVASEVGASYTVSFYAKTDTPGAKLSLLSQMARWSIFPLSERIALTKDWKRYSFTFECPSSFFRIGFGERWWDEGKDDQIDGAQIWLDAVQIEKSDQASAFTQKPIFAWADVPAVDNVYPTEAGRMPVKVSIVNTTDASRPVAMDVSIQDMDRHGLMSETLKRDLAPQEQATVDLDVAPLERRGMMRIVMDATSKDYAETFYGRVGVFEPITEPGHVVYGYGMTPDEPDRGQGTSRDHYLSGGGAKERLARLQDYGVWGSIAFSPPDDPSIIDHLNEIGWMHLFRITLGPENPEGMSGKLLHVSDPLNETQWKQFDRAIKTRADRYPNQKYFKTVNEPGGPKWSPAEIARAVGLVYKHVKANNPDAVVISPDMSGAGSHERQWMDEFFKAGGNKVVDTLAIHTYRDRPEDPSLQADIDALNAMRRKYGLTDHKMLFTEGEGRWGYSLQELNMSPFKSWSEWRLKLLSYDIGRDELAAAAVHLRTMLVCFRNHDDVGLYISWNDDFQDGMPRATLFTINYLYALLRHAQFQREFQLGEDTKTYLFEKTDGTPVAVLWSYDLKVDRGQAPPPQASIPMPEGSNWQLLDMMGNPIATTHAGGGLQFDVSGHPVYLVANGASTSELAAALEQGRIGGGQLRSVDFALRMASPTQGTVEITNRLLRRVEGQLDLTASGLAAKREPVELEPRRQAAIGFEVPPARADKVQALDLDLRFDDFEMRQSTQTQRRLSYFLIPRLPEGVALTADARPWQDVPAMQARAAAGSGGDAAATAKLGWREDGLHLLVEVQDANHDQSHAIAEAAAGDALRLFVDVYADGSDTPGAGYDESDHDIVIAKATDGDKAFRLFAPNWQVGFVHLGAADDIDVKVTRTGQTTRYLVHLPPTQFKPLRLEPGTPIAIGLAVSDRDGAGDPTMLGVIGELPLVEHPEAWPVGVLGE